MYSITKHIKNIYNRLNKKEIIHVQTSVKLNIKYKDVKKSDLVVKKDKDILEFNVEYDMKEGNRGWVEHGFFLKINGLNAGYIKLSYIPKEHWDYFKGDIVKWGLDQNKVDTDGYNDAEYIHNNINTKEFKSKFIIKNKEQMERYGYETNDKESIENKYEKMKEILKDNYSRQYKSDRDYFVNKPSIAYVRLYDEYETIQYNKEYFENNPNKKISFINKGYSKYLYRIALKWVSINEMCLYKSMTNENSDRVWKRLEKSKKYYKVKNSLHVPRMNDKYRYLITNKEEYIKLDPFSEKKLVKKRKKVIRKKKSEKKSTIDSNNEMNI